MVTGFVTSVVCKVIAGKYVVRARVRHSQRMNDSCSEHLGNYADAKQSALEIGTSLFLFFFLFFFLHGSRK